MKDGATKRRDEMALLASWYLKASSSASGVKNSDIVGTSMLSFDLRYAGFGWNWFMTVRNQCFVA